MGCFDVACGISSMTIKHGNDALLLLLIPQTDYPDSIDLLRSKVEIDIGVQQVFNEGPTGLYMPFCMPIRGKYNDYGSLEEIVEDETYKALLKYFVGTWEQIINVLHRGRYGTLHDEEMLSLYGTGLIKGYSGDKAVTPKWLLEAGFTERDGKFFHPEVTQILKWGETGKVEKTEEQKAYVTFKVPFKGSNETKVMPHIVYWENDKWNEIWQREQKDFCKSFMEYSKPMGWFAADHGVVLGIKPEYVKKAMLLRKLSGMFIDGMFYDSFTESVKTNEYYQENAANLVDAYMNKYVMELMGFKPEYLIDDETKKQLDPNSDDYKYTKHKRAMLYSHSDADGFKFSVRLSRSMATDIYRVDKGKLVEVNTRQGKNNYHPFSPKGLAEMFEGVIGTKLDLSVLDGVTPLDIMLMRIKDLLAGRSVDKEMAKDLKAKLAAFPKDDKSPEYQKLLNKYFAMSDRSDAREDAKEVFGDFNFPLVYDFYEASFLKPNKKFKNTCYRFKNFMTSLWGINRFLIPSAHFGQHGDYKNQLVFSKIVADVIKAKILKGYAEEFTDKNSMFETIKLVHGDDYYEKPEKTVVGKGEYEKEQTSYMYKGEEVAVWYEKDNYGYLITEEGL